MNDMEAKEAYERAMAWRLEYIRERRASRLSQSQHSGKVLGHGQANQNGNLKSKALLLGEESPSDATHPETQDYVHAFSTDAVGSSSEDGECDGLYDDDDDDDDDENSARKEPLEPVWSEQEGLKWQSRSERIADEARHKAEALEKDE